MEHREHELTRHILVGAHLSRVGLFQRAGFEVEGVVPFDESYSICVATQQYRSVISGIGLHARNLVARLSADGHAVVLLAPEDQRPPNGGPLSFYGVPPPLFAGTQARWLTLAWSFGRALRTLQRKQAFDLIHFTDARESLFCDLRSRLSAT